MQTSRDTAAETEGATSIRLRYSRQFQSGGHAHTIDAEATLAVGASLERREQVIRELEAGVAQLVRQIAQRGSRSTGEGHPQTSARPEVTTSKTTELTAPALPRAIPNATQPTAPLPVSESMPATPAASGNRPISLPYFLDYIKKRWSMSGQDAMELLDVRELTGLNLREALFKLRDLKESQSMTNSGFTSNKTTQPSPPGETSHQANNRSASVASNSRPSASQAAPNTAPVARESGTPPTALKYNMPPDPRTSSGPTRVSESDLTVPERVREVLPDFAGSPKSPLPIQIGVVRDLSQPTYSFEEEDEDGYEQPGNNQETASKLIAERKLERLRAARTENTASPERLGVLNNVIGEQISEVQLGKLIKAVWGFTGKKRLKVQQVEELISWAKEDYFAEEVENLLALIQEEGE